MGQSSTTHLTRVTTQRDRQEDMADFTLLLAHDDAGLKEVIHALYYLPANYKLLVLGSALSKLSKFMPWAEQAIMSRIQFENGSGLSEGASPFSSADAVIYSGSANPNFDTAQKPLVVVSETATDQIASNEHFGFTVPTGNPEALATAVLRISREQA